MTIEDLINICWESRWRHLLFRFPQDAVVTKDADGLINIHTPDGKFWGLFDLERKLFWSYDVHGDDISLEPV